MLVPRCDVSSMRLMFQSRAMGKRGSPRRPTPHGTSDSTARDQGSSRQGTVYQKASRCHLPSSCVVRCDVVDAGRELAPRSWPLKSVRPVVPCKLRPFWSKCNPPTAASDRESYDPLMDSGRGACPGEVLCQGGSRDRTNVSLCQKKRYPRAVAGVARGGGGRGEKPETRKGKKDAKDGVGPG